MRGREFLAVLGVAITGPFAAQSQQPVSLVGLLSSRSARSDVGYISSFRIGLKESGHVEGANLRLEARWADNDLSKIEALANELIDLKPSVIVAAGGAPPAITAKKLTTSVPIVFVNGADPVQSGLVRSMNRPEANLTGISFLATQIVAKRLELLRDLLPSARSFAVLVNPNNPGTPSIVQDLDRARQAMGISIKTIEARSQIEIEKGFESIVGERTDALLIGSDALFGAARQKLIALARHHALPAAFDNREFASDGGLMSYGTSIADAYRQAGRYVGRILSGTKPNELPVLQSTRFELVINLATAKSLGIPIPSKLMALVDEVIE